MFGAMLIRIGARRGWRALNKRDLDYLERWVADDVVYDVSGPPPFGGHFEGKAAWREANKRWMDALPTFHIRRVHDAVSNPFALGLTNIVLSEYELVARMHDGRTFRTLGIDVSEMRRGKLVTERNYLFDLDRATAFMAPPAEEPPRRARRSPAPAAV